MKKLNCEKIEDKLPLYLERELSQGEAREIEEHLLACAKCRALLKEWERCFFLLGNVPRLEAPLHLWQSIRAHLPRRVKRKVFLSRRWVLVPVVALLLIVVELAILHHFRLLFAPPIAERSTAIMFSPPSKEPTAPLLPKPMPQPTRPTPQPSRPKISPPSIAGSSVAKAQPLPSTTTPEGSGVEEMIVKRLQMALLSAQSAENSLERVFKTLEGEREF